MLPVSILPRALPRRLLLVGAAALGVWGGASRVPVVGQPAGDAVVVGAAPRYVGVGSCTASSCHNKNGPAGSKGSEYSTWALYDRHTKAYTVLENNKSKTIQKNRNATVAATKDALCLKCHAVDLGPDQLAQALACNGVAEAFPFGHPLHKNGAELSLSDGVSCESCHGPAEKWLAEHYKPGWQALPDAHKAMLGFQPTKSFDFLVAKCVECHVGSADKQVDHDLIAAGHPRLNFEYAAFMANMPRHWNSASDVARLQAKQPGASTEAYDWVQGQVATAEGALRLLKARAEAAKAEKGPWPEFSEYDCFACHHDLKKETARQSKDWVEGRKLGSLPWSPWYTEMPRLLANKVGDAGAVAALDAVATEMSKPYPNPGTVVSLADAALAALQGLRGRLPAADQATVADLTALLQAADAKASGSWDRSAQRYLGLAAMESAGAQLGNRQPGLKEVLRQKVVELQFPDKLDSPRNFPPNRSSK